MHADYVNGGELFTHLYQREKFSENEVRIYIGEIVLALEHLHKVKGRFAWPILTAALFLWTHKTTSVFIFQKMLINK